MAGIKVPRHEIFKIGTDKLKYNKWDLKLNSSDALDLGECIDLFQAQEFRLIAKILNKKPEEIDYKKYILAVVLDNYSDFNKMTDSKRGITVNGITYKRFVGTTGGLKGDTLLFVNEEILDELNRRCEAGRDKNIKLVPAKYEAYKALTCSASQEIISPKRILVVRDCITKFRDDVINIDDSDESLEEPVMQLLKDVELENNASDGFNLCTIEFMKKVCKALDIDYTTSGVCLRNAWLKGMLYPFPIIEFVDKYNNGNYFIEDIWGNTQDIRECEMILTESSLKLWSAYSSIEDYMSSYKECGYEFAVTKISPHKLDDYREVNYQYLQSYNFDDEDIVELCQPTVDFLKNSLCGDYKSTLDFLGVDEKHEEDDWQKALFTNEFMINDPYIIDSVHRLIKKKINDAKIGKLMVHGNYQIASGDPFALMQSICGLEVTGLLKADEVYSKYWIDESVDEIVIFRSPMTSHNNIRKCKVVDNNDVRYWYQYMDTIMIINAWDTFCMAENGEDFDSDLNFSTNNPVLLRKHVKLPAIQCVQRNTVKEVITEEAILKTNRNGMGNDVGGITNKVTSMIEVQSRFPKDSREYKDLEFRIACGQLYQQNELDKIKGIVARPMPEYWYNKKACKGDKYLESICADKKPYFMMYRYDEKKKTYNKTIKEMDRLCKLKVNKGLSELINSETVTEEESQLLTMYYNRLELGFGDCAMNRICRYIEDQFKDYTILLKQSSIFDATAVINFSRRCTKQHREVLIQLNDKYVDNIATYKKEMNKKSIVREEKSEKARRREKIKTSFKEMSKVVCPNDQERFKIMVELYDEKKINRQFFWDVAGKQMIEALEVFDYEDYIK